VILTRYGQDEDTVVAGILHDVVEDCVRDRYTREMLEQRIGEKFGAEVLDAVLAVTKRALDNDGIEMSSEEQKADYLNGSHRPASGRGGLCAADKVHNVPLGPGRPEADRVPRDVWNRFSGGREATVRWYRRVHDRLAEVGFDAPIMDELRATAEELEHAGAMEAARREGRVESPVC
jgi:hypothetical protein